MENTEAAPAAPAVASPAVSETNTQPVSSQEFQDALIAELRNEGLVKEAPAAAPAAVEAESSPAAEAAPPPVPTPEAATDPLGRSFEKLAKEKAEFRKEQELYKNEIEAIKKAKALKDPLSVLAATGFTYNDVVERVMASVGGKPPEAAKEDAKPNLSEASELKARLERLEAYEAQQQRANIMNQAKAFIRPDKYPFTAQFGDVDSVMQVITDFHNRTGTLPGNTFEESISIAAEQVEKFHRQNAERYTKAVPGSLTPPKAPLKLDVEPARETAARQVNPGKTLTNTSAPVARGTPDFTTSDDLIADLLADPNFK